MFRELCNPVTMRLVALGHPLQRVEEQCSSPLPGPMTCQMTERLAAVIVLWVVLLCTMAGYTISVIGIPQQARDQEIRLLHTPSRGSVVAGICGILPAFAGTAGNPSCDLLHR